MASLPGENRPATHAAISVFHRAKTNVIDTASRIGRKIKQVDLSHPTSIPKPPNDPSSAPCDGFPGPGKCDGDDVVRIAAQRNRVFLIVENNMRTRMGFPSRLHGPTPAPLRPMRLLKATKSLSFLRISHRALPFSRRVVRSLFKNPPILSAE